MSTLSIVAIFAILFGWLATAIDDVSIAFRGGERRNVAIVKTTLGVVATTAGICLFLYAEISKAHNVARAACGIEEEVRGNGRVLEQLLSFSVDAALRSDDRSAGAHELERYLRMLEGSPFRRTNFNARSNDIASLPDELPNHVYTLYALLELCEQHRDRVLREVRATDRAEFRIKYLASLRDSCSHLQRGFTVTMSELKSVCAQRG